MAIKLSSGSSFDAQINESNTAGRQYYLPDNNSGLGTKLMNMVATWSGTTIDFTGIPSWAKRITILLNAVSTSGASHMLIQLGSSTFQTTGYSSDCNSSNTGIGTTSLVTTGMVIMNDGATTTRTCTMTLTHMGTNIWIASVVGCGSAPSTVFGGGNVTLSGALDRIRLTTVNGTDTFDNGTMNVMYE